MTLKLKSAHGYLRHSNPAHSGKLLNFWLWSHYMDAHAAMVEAEQRSRIKLLPAHVEPTHIWPTKLPAIPKKRRPAPIDESSHERSADAKR